MLRLDFYDRKRLELLAKHCTGHNVLDLGYAQLPNPFFPNDIHRVGFDCRTPDPSYPTQYEEKVVGDIADIGTILSGCTFDNIVAGEFIEHLERPYDFLRSVRGLLSPGGRLLISTPNPLGFPVILWEMTRSKRRFFTSDHVYYFCPRWVNRMLDYCGYSVTCVRGVGFWNPVVRIPCPVSLSYQVIYVAVPHAA